MTEAELSCRAQAIRGESCIVQSSMEVSFGANYPSDKNDTVAFEDNRFQKSFERKKFASFKQE